MQEIPLLCTDEVVRAYLSGRKTQTRRPIKWATNQAGEPADHLCQIGTSGRWIAWWGLAGKAECQRRTDATYEPKLGLPGLCQAGDRVWIRECWTADHAAFYPNFPILYRADGYDPTSENTQNDPPGKVYSPEQKAWYPFRWRPNIHMKRQHARIVLPVVSVRAERVRGISEADAIAEGLEPLPPGPIPEGRNGQDGTEIYLGESAAQQYMDLWRSLYGTKHPPETSWCWVIETEPYQGAKA